MSRLILWIKHQYTRFEMWRLSNVSPLHVVIIEHPRMGGRFVGELQSIAMDWSEADELPLSGGPAYRDVTIVIREYLS